MSQTQKTCDTIISAQQALLGPNLQTASNIAIAINKGLIVAIDNKATIEQEYQSNEHYTLESHLLMPGLINAHGHSAMSLFRGFADDMPLMQWLEEKIWPLENQWVSADFVYTGTKLAIAEMLRSGTTCYSDMYFFPESAAKAAQESGMRCQLSFPVFDFPCSWGDGADDYLAKGEALMQQFQNHTRISVIPGPHAPYTVNNDNLIKAKALADKYHCGLQIHLHETAFEVEQSLSDYGQRPLARLDALGILNRQTQAVHMTTLNDEDISLCQQHGLSVIHCPESNLKLASGFCPSQKLIDAGINLALGTDGAASNNDLDLFGELRTAALIAKASHQDPSAFNAHTALKAATINGAKALDLEHITGSLCVGKAGDIIAIDLSQIEQQPHYDAHSLLTYSNIAPRVSHSFIQGQCLVENGELHANSQINTEQLINEVKSWQAKIKSL